MMTYVRVVECCSNCTNFRQVKMPDGEFKTLCIKNHNLQSGPIECSDYAWSRMLHPVTDVNDVLEFNSYMDLVRHQISSESGLPPEMFDTSTTIMDMSLEEAFNRILESYLHHKQERNAVFLPKAELIALDCIKKAIEANNRPSSTELSTCKCEKCLWCRHNDEYDVNICDLAFTHLDNEGKCIFRKDIDIKG